MRYIAGSVKIVSVFPGTLPILSRPYGTSPDPSAGRNTEYELQPCPKGAAPFILEVFDSFQSQRDPAEPTNLEKVTTHQITAEQLGQDLLRNWTSGFIGVPPGSKPGIGLWLDDGPPSEEFVRDLRTIQAGFFDALFHEGERLAFINENKQITQLMREAAKYLGKERAWVQNTDPDSLKKCPFCQSQIPSVAYICPSCRMTVAKIPAELLALQAQYQASAPPATAPAPAQNQPLRPQVPVPAGANK